VPVPGSGQRLSDRRLTSTALIGSAEVVRPLLCVISKDYLNVAKYFGSCCNSAANSYLSKVAGRAFRKVAVCAA
jgi:hypothetical protein